MTRRAARHNSRRAGLASGATTDEWLARAIGLAEAGRSTEARKAALRALKADPGNTAARHIAGLLEIGEFEAQQLVVRAAFSASATASMRSASAVAMVSRRHQRRS